MKDQEQLYSVWMVATVTEYFSSDAGCGEGTVFEPKECLYKTSFHTEELLRTSQIKCVFTDQWYLHITFLKVRLMGLERFLSS